jgi:predicted RNase H-like nuclease (RuvC/YqgF family)
MESYEKKLEIKNKKQLQNIVETLASKDDMIERLRVEIDKLSEKIETAQFEVSELRTLQFQYKANQGVPQDWGVNGGNDSQLEDNIDDEQLL